jgi:hypothetical protein
MIGQDQVFYPIIEDLRLFDNPPWLLRGISPVSITYTMSTWNKLWNLDNQFLNKCNARFLQILLVDIV